MIYSRQNKARNSKIEANVRKVKKSKSLFKTTLRKTKRAKSGTAQGTECYDKIKLKISYIDNLNLTDI